LILSPHPFPSLAVNEKDFGENGRGWEIHMESEKLYCFTINILGKKKKTLPIPSGKRSILIDKL
jgi:hypothetical protein